METTVSPTRIAMNTGAITAALMLGASFVGWQRVGWVIFGVGIFYGMKLYRNEIGGAIGYGRALQAGVQTAFFMSLVLSFVVYMSAFFDPSVIGKTLEAMEERLIASEIPAAAMEQMKETMTPIMLAAFSIVAYCILGGFISLVFAFFVKKQPIIEEQT